MDITRAPQEQAARRLLEASGLPTADLTPAHFRHFLACGDPRDPGGVVGLEVHGRDALLRSLAVDPGRRGRGCGLALVAAAERHAAAEGVQCVYLLTTTAAGFFERLGYAPAARADAPAAIRACAEFASLCPEDSAFMVKRLAAAP